MAVSVTAEAAQREDTAVAELGLHKAILTLQ